ncbi:hypothetical protein D4764_0190540 [Takifugu flavidus]|uniref:FISNA domain-containing protein n=1 Tax=Takifugu flavidus TaxID=433684 RepID=A0A5C6MFN1_9TELE|nr:hypothetical protein D4764_0190540 [Takifugu flavidus]
MSLKSRCEHVTEGTNEAGSGTLLNKIYTELYITEGQVRGGHTHESTSEWSDAFSKVSNFVRQQLTLGQISPISS